MLKWSKWWGSHIFSYCSHCMNLDQCSFSRVPSQISVDWNQVQLQGAMQTSQWIGLIRWRGICFRFQKMRAQWYSHLSEIKSDGFFSSSGPDQSNRSLWRERSPGWEAVSWNGTNKVTVLGWQVIAKPVVSTCLCVSAGNYFLNNGRIFIF